MVSCLLPDSFLPEVATVKSYLSQSHLLHCPVSPSSSHARAIIQHLYVAVQERHVWNCRLKDTLSPVINTLREADIGPELGQTLKIPLPFYGLQ